MYSCKEPQNYVKLVLKKTMNCKENANKSKWSELVMIILNYNIPRPVSSWFWQGYLYPHLPDLSHVVRLIVDCSLGTCVLTYKLIKRGKSVN